MMTRNETGRKVTPRRPMDVNNKQRKTKVKCMLCGFFLSDVVTSPEDLKTHDELWHQMGHTLYFELWTKDDEGKWSGKRYV